MNALAKLTIKPVTRSTNLSPIEMRRNKLLSAIEEQLKVADAAIRGEEYAVTQPRWGKNDAGEKVRVQRTRVVRAWFFQQDDGFYVQCKYGAKAIALSKDGNSVFVKQIQEVKGVLEAFCSATRSGELDRSVETVVKQRKS